LKKVYIMRITWLFFSVLSCVHFLSDLKHSCFWCVFFCSWSKRNFYSLCFVYLGYRLIYTYGQCYVLPLFCPPPPGPTPHPNPFAPEKRRDQTCVEKNQVAVMRLIAQTS
jgi:hypothetical protein